VVLLVVTTGQNQEDIFQLIAYKRCQNSQLEQNLLINYYNNINWEWGMGNGELSESGFPGL